MTRDQWTPGARADDGRKIPPPPPAIKLAQPAPKPVAHVKHTPEPTAPTPRSEKNLANRGKPKKPKLVMGLNGQMVTKRGLKKQRYRRNQDAR
jgi:hypothetical protein